MKYTSKRKIGNCQIIKKIVNGRRTFKCKNMKRPPTSQEIIDELNMEKRK